ncbi:MAG: Cerebroside-sulfatase [Planctomycetota bacterium]|nr:MAG: Cerebroside-sulfatase [Planctomycetota bacterium]
MRWPLAVPICLFLLSPVLGQPQDAANPPRPNIVLILADDVGREVLGCYGGESYETPHINALARGGRRFTHCYSMPVCHPTRICLLTGKYPARLGNPQWGTFPRDEENRTLAARLQRAGYATAIAGKWQLELLKNDPDQPSRMGFQRWSLFGWHEGPRYHDPMIYQNGKLRTDTEGKFGPDLYVDFLVDFIRKNRQRPFFAYYSMALCHDVTNDIGHPVPYGPDGRWLSYAEMVHEMDEHVGRLVEALDTLGVRDNTLILFTGDNGTASASFIRYENDAFVRPKVFSRIDGREVQGGKGQLTDWGTRVPLIANWPSHVPADTTCDDLVDSSDFLPTLCDLAGATVPDASMLDGHSFAKSLLGTGHTSRDWAYSERGAERHFVRTQRYKLYASGKFYDMQSDPDERHPLAAEKLTKDQQRVKGQLQAALASLPQAK